MGIKNFFKKIGMSKEEIKKKSIPTLSNVKDGVYQEETTPPSGINKVEEKKEDAEKELDKPISYEDLVIIMINRAKKDGQTFDTDEHARQWAIRKVDKIAEKIRKKGAPICCKVCGSSEVKGIGPFKRVGNEYAHDCCIIKQNEQTSKLITQSKEIQK